VAFQEIPAVVSLANQTASIPTSNLFVVGPLGAGMYAVWADIITTSAGSGGTVTISVNWDNGTTLASLVSTAFGLTAVGEQAALLGNFYATLNSTVTYSTTVAGAAGNPVYALRIRLQFLG
jgi:hypothetical protein